MNGEGGGPLGNTLSLVLPLPMSLMAGLACVTSDLFSGHAGLYRSQRLGESKHGDAAGAERAARNA